MKAEAAAIAAYLIRLAALIEHTDEPVELHIVDDAEIVVDREGRGHTERNGGTAVAVVLGEAHDKLVSRIKAEL